MYKFTYAHCPDILQLKLLNFRKFVVTGRLDVSDKNFREKKRCCSCQKN